jgi:uncharacterized protein
MAVSSTRKTALILAILIAATSIVPAAAQPVSSDWITSIEDYAYQVDLETSAEIVVVVLPSLTGNDITDDAGQEITDIVHLGVYIFNEMPLETFDGTQVGIGKEGKDNGILIILALKEQQWRIEVGYGLEGYVTDIETNRIAQQYLVPQLKQGNYGEALYDTVAALAEEIPATNQTDTSSVRGYYYYEAGSPQSDQTPWWDFDYYGLPLWLVIILALLGVALPMFGSRRSRGGRSGGGGSTGRW